MSRKNKDNLKEEVKTEKTGDSSAKKRGKSKAEKASAKKALRKEKKAQKLGRNPRYQELTWEEYRDDHGTPRSRAALIWMYIKNLVSAFIHHLPSTLIPMVIVYVVMFLFNVYFWSILNDTMWIGRGTVGKSEIAPYLVGGGVYEGTAFKGVTPFDKKGEFLTGSLVAPLTFALGLLIPRLIYRILQRGPIAPIKDLFSIIPLRNHYMDQNKIQTEKAETDKKNKSKKSGILLRTGIFCACIACFLIRNPFAVFVFMLLFFLSFGQGAESQIGRGIFIVKATDKKLYDGRKNNYPVYADGMLWLYYLAVGFAICTGLNIILWIFFDYNFYVRLGVTVFLAAGSLFLSTGKGKKRKMVETAVGFLAVFGFFFWLDRLTALADDSGWSESGKSPQGLMNNTGWEKTSKSSGLPAVSGDSGTLLSMLQRYQKMINQHMKDTSSVDVNDHEAFAQRVKELEAQGMSTKEAIRKITNERGADVKDETDAWALKKVNDTIRDLKAGKNVSANEMEHLRNLVQDTYVDGHSGNPNAPLGEVDDTAVPTALGNTFEEVARGNTLAAAGVRGGTAFLTGGSSEAAMAYVSAGYGMHDYVQSDGDNWVVAAEREGIKYTTNTLAGEGGKALFGSMGVNVSGKTGNAIEAVSGILNDNTTNQAVGSNFWHNAENSIQNTINDIKNIWNNDKTNKMSVPGSPGTLGAEDSRTSLNDLYEEMGGKKK